MSIVAALFAVGVFVYDPATTKEIGELASRGGTHCTSRMK